MSRSRRKIPKVGMTTAESEREDKQLWHRKFRRVNRQFVKNGEEPVDVKDVSSPWEMAKDGKQYCPDWNPVYRK